MTGEVERMAAEEEDQQNRGPHMGIEICFNNIVHKFTHTNYFANHQILKSDQSNWSYLWCLWDLQFFYKLFACAEDHSNPVNGLFCIAPLSVAEYFYSANHNLLVPLLPPIYEEDNFGQEEEGNHLYYHLM